MKITLPESDPTRAAATRRVERKIGFFIHASTYLVVNSGLIALNLLRTPAIFWAAAPLLGWGIGLLFHGLKVWMRVPTQWKQRMIEQEMRNHRQ